MDRRPTTGFVPRTLLTIRDIEGSANMLGRPLGLPSWAPIVVLLAVLVLIARKQQR